MPESSSQTSGSATSAITLLALASFAAQAMVRVTDSLLPQIAADLNVSVGATSIVVTAYLLAHGSVQLVIGPIGDRVGKYLCVSIAAAGSTAMVVACGLAPSLPVLVAARLACGLATGWIIPFALAFVGDVIPYERRQQVIGRFLSGQILGQLFGQAAGGLAEQLPKDLPGQEATDHLLAALVGDHVADEGERERNDPAGGQPAGQPRRHQHRQRGRQSAGHHHRGRSSGGDGNAQIFADAVADRADHQLHRAVRQQIGGDHDRGRADADIEVGGDLRQQRIGDPHHGLGGEGGERQQRDGAGGAAARLT